MADRHGLNDRNLDRLAPHSALRGMRLESSSIAWFDDRGFSWYRCRRAIFTTCTLLAMLSGANHFAYGSDGRGEIIAAQKCTLVTGKTYLLQDLLRGRFGTEWAMGLHAAGHSVILLDSADLEAIPMDSAQIGAALL